MQRGIIFFMLVWTLVAIGIAIYSHLSSSEKLSVKRGLIYSFITATIASGFVAAMVFFF